MEGKSRRSILKTIISKLNGGATNSSKCNGSLTDKSVIDIDNVMFEFAFNNPQFSNHILQIRVFDVDEKLESLKQIHVNSLALAAKSTFFYNLFSNSKKEYPVTIVINTSEEAPFMELLNFMYGMKLTESSSMLLNVMALADKFQVCSCIQQCVRLLADLPLTREYAFRCLDVCSRFPTRSECAQQSIDKVKEFLASSYKDLKESEDEICNMTFTAIEGVFGGEKLWASEDEVFEIVLKWARKHFPALKKRQKRLGFYITRLVRFPFMTLRKLREVLMCEDLNREFAKHVVNEALFFKADPLHCNGALNNERQFIARTYMKRIVFYDLQLEKCKKLKGGETLYSETYLLGKQTFSLRMEHHNESNSFALYLDMRDTSLAPIKVVCEISAKLKPQMSFTEQFKFEKHYNVNQTRWGFHNMTDILWESFTSDHSRYFIDGILHLRAELYIVE